MTGATGFIGNSLVEELLDNGYDVIPVGMTLKPWTSDFIRENLHKIDLVTENINWGIKRPILSSKDKSSMQFNKVKF